jgi:hypothetical protein
MREAVILGAALAAGAAVALGLREAFDTTGVALAAGIVVAWIVWGEIGDRLAARLGIPVHLVDERLTSVRATRAVRGIGLPRRKREDRTRIDAAAAALILQGWLDGHRREDGPTETPFRSPFRPGRASIRSSTR